MKKLTAPTAKAPRFLKRGKVRITHSATDVVIPAVKRSLLCLITVTCTEEQTKIGNLFKNLDTLISQQQYQLKKLNNIKQACLA